MSFDAKSNTHLPREFATAHGLAFAIHDILLQQLHAGWRGNAWIEQADAPPGLDPGALLDGESPLDCMLRIQEPEKIASFLNRTVYPFLLGDFLHYIYEALECSRKGKTTVAFSLLRKPLKESLFVLEILSSDPQDFACRFRDDIATLYSNDKTVKDKEKWHEDRVRSALVAANALDMFDPAYIAQLRYSHNEEDSFAGSFDKATHLVTNRQAIKTEPLNFNFIFSDHESLATHWAYIYSRLPYLMSYVWRICEHAFARYGWSDPVYIEDINRRVMASVLLWYPTIGERYRCSEIIRFAEYTRSSLHDLCVGAGWRTPEGSDLERMAVTGAWPGEFSLKVLARGIRYKLGVKAGDILGRL